MIPPMRKTNEASLFSYNGESINEGEQRKAAVAVAVAAVVPYDITAEEVMAFRPDGLFLSNNRF